MASFPTSVKTWTALVDRTNYPQAADLNTVYDEVTAIETGYLTGTAPLNSSASTVASLSVTGGATFAGSITFGNSTFSNVSVSSGSTFVGTAIFSSLVTLNGQPRAVVYNSSKQSINSSGVWTALTFDSETLDVGGLHSTVSTAASRLTVPTGCSGTYWLWGRTYAPGGVSVIVRARLSKNSTTVLGTAAELTTGTSPALASVPNPTALAVLDAADYVEMEVSVTSTHTFGSTSRVNASELGMMRIG